MIRYLQPTSLSAVALYSALGIGLAIVRAGSAAPTDIVDVDASNQRNPPASTTDKSPAPPEGVDTSSGGKAATKADIESRDAAKGEAAKEKLKLRAGERVGSSPRGAARVLGMSLQEGTQGSVKVVDVALNSPAFDAGVMKGDEIVAFQGFRGENYRKWIDGIQRLTADTGTGLKIPVVLARGGKQLTVGIAIPERIFRSSNPRLPSPPGNAPMPPAGGPSLPIGPAVANSTNVATAIDNSGPFGEFFGGASASPKDSAMAHLVRIGGQPAPAAGAGSVGSNNGDKENVPPNTLDQPTAAPIRGGARVGMAGFRDDPSGMVVMVDVGALPSGTYTVAIADPSVLGGAAVTGVAPTPPNVQSPVQQPAQPAQQQNPTAVPNNASRPTVDPADPGGIQGGDVAKASAPSGGVTLNHIGTLTVDQTGTGRMQQKVETVQVRAVLGQALVLYSTQEPQTATNATPQAGSASQAALAAPATGGAQVPVVGGIIQLITDRRPNDNAAPQTSQPPAATNGAVEQPANATPVAPQNVVR